jgi:hypothetical protein
MFHNQQQQYLQQSPNMFPNQQQQYPSYGQQQYPSYGQQQYLPLPPGYGRGRI